MMIDKSRLKRDYEKFPIKRGTKIFKDIPFKEDLEYLYLELNLSASEVADFFNKKVSSAEGWLRFYSIKKPASKARETYKRSMLAKYGVDSPLKCKSIKRKADESIFKKYGVTNVSYDPLIRKKISKALKESLSINRDKVLRKRKNTTLLRYGKEYTSSLDSVKDKIQKTCREKYGVNFPCQTKQCIEANLSNNSVFNCYWKNLLKVSDENSEFVLNNFRYDLKIGNTLVEVNPTHTHNSTHGYFVGKSHIKKPLPKDYHQRKTVEAEKSGYRVFHIFDFDCNTPEKEFLIVNTLIGSKVKIRASKCVVREVSLKDSKEFVNLNHLQGFNKYGTKVSLGLYYNEELVEIMTFGKPRYNKNYQYELLRLCTKFDYKVYGGASKLFKYFVDNYIPKSIISYCNYSKFDGKVYQNMGMQKVEVTTPNKIWYNQKTKKRVDNNILLKYGFDKLLGKYYGCFGKGTSNEELMREAGFVEIYDCGQIKFVWNADTNLER